MASQSLLPRLGDWFSAHGRLSRKQYFFGLAVLFAISIVTLGPLAILYEHTSNYGTARTQAALACLLLLMGLGVLLGYTMFCLHAKRLHDLGMPAIIALAFVVGIPLGLGGLALLYCGGAPWLIAISVSVGKITRDVNIGMGGYLLLAPGEKHDNQYGADPL